MRKKSVRYPMALACAALAWSFVAPARADTWIFAGQSNMSCRNIGPAFENEIAAAAPDITITRECVQKNGSSMSWDWMPGKDKFNDLMSTIDGAGSDLTGIVWYQGESEAGVDGRTNFQDNMATFFGAIRQAAGNDNLPIIVVQLSNAGGYKYEVSWAVVRELQRRLAEDPAVRVVTSIDGVRYTRDSCPYRCDPDGYDTQHITEESKEMIGVRAARAALHLAYGREAALPPTLERVYRTGADNRRIVLQFSSVGQGLSIGPDHSEIRILGGRTFAQWVPEEDEEVRLGDYAVPVTSVEMVDDSTIAVMLESGVAGPLVCSYANTAGGMESILLDLGIAVGDEPSPTFLVDVEETSRIREVLTPAVARMTREDLPGGWYMPTGRSLAPSGNPMHRSMQALIRPGGQQEAPATLFVPTKRK